MFYISKKTFMVLFKHIAIVLKCDQYNHAAWICKCTSRSKGQIDILISVSEKHPRGHWEGKLWNSVPLLLIVVLMIQSKNISFTLIITNLNLKFKQHENTLLKYTLGVLLLAVSKSAANILLTVVTTLCLSMVNCSVRLG